MSTLSGAVLACSVADVVACFCASTPAAAAFNSITGVELALRDCSLRSRPFLYSSCLASLARSRAIASSCSRLRLAASFSPSCSAHAQNQPRCLCHQHQRCPHPCASRSAVAQLCQPHQASALGNICHSYLASTYRFAAHAGLFAFSCLLLPGFTLFVRLIRRCGWCSGCGCR